MDKSKHLFEIVMETPKGAANAYEWDAHSQTIRLYAVNHNHAAQPLERGQIANSLSAYGEPLSALLVISLPTFQGCRVQARLLGALQRVRGESNETLVVAVAEADARLAATQHYTELERDAYAYIENALQHDAVWLDATAAYEIVHAARQRWTLARGNADSGVAAPAWQMDEQDAVTLRAETDLTRYSRAEARLYTLPLRFQNYVAALLAPRERILFWVHRPLLTRARLGVFGREVLRQGLLVLTDQQFLWLRDPVTPSHTVEGYGYIARTFALERTLRAAVQQHAHGFALCVTLGNVNGAQESLEIEFPPHARAELEEAARLLMRFAPRAEETQLARQRVLEPDTRPLRDPTTSDAEQTRATLERLQNALRAALRDEIVYAQAFVPEWGEAQLLTVTNRFLRMTPDPSKRAAPTAIPLSHIGSVEICCSQLGSWFRVWLPTPTNLEKWELQFPVVFQREFSECATALRVLLGTPLKAESDQSNGGVLPK